MVGLEKNGPILFVKPFPKPEALEIGSCLDQTEQFVLKKICPDYSVTCVNREGKASKKHTDAVCAELEQFNTIILMGKQCATLLSLGHEYQEWGNRPFFIGGKKHTFWFTPALGNIMTSNKRLKQFRTFVENVIENL
tara:strand:+ start:5822 stop:6232 length:411 start_codon:yes stop_codon:yes gene_type:complete